MNRNITLSVLKEYCLATSQHGYRNLAQPRRSVLERFFWSLVMAVAMVCSAVFVHLAIHQYNVRPTLISIETSHYPVWNIPFPSVTLCPINKVNREMLKSLLATWNVSDNTSVVLQDARYVTSLLGEDPGPRATMSRLQKLLDDNNVTISSFLRKVAPSCRNILLSCKFKGRVNRCEKLFSTVFTERGVCCGFNKWGDRINEVRHDPIARVSACGYKMGLSVVIRQNVEAYHTTTFSSYGYQVLLEDAAGSQTWLLPPQTRTLLSLRPEALYTSKSARSLQPQSCQQALSYRDCVLRCRMQRVWQLCDCDPFYAPRNEGRRECHFTDAHCLEKHKVALEVEDGSRCNCVPQCDQVRYSAEASFAKMHWPGTVKWSDVAHLDVFYVDLVGTRYRKDVFFTWRGLLASVGGILGLTLGFSLVSCFEAAYFFTVRVFVDIKFLRTTKTSFVEP